MILYILWGVIITLWVFAVLALACRTRNTHQDDDILKNTDNEEAV